MFRLFARFLVLLFAGFLLLGQRAPAEDGVFVRFKLVEPAGVSYYINLGGHVHTSPWSLPGAVFPADALKDKTSRFKAGEYTGWFDVKTYAGKLLHGRAHLSGGVAEFPTLTADFVMEPAGALQKVIIELATAPAEVSIVKRFETAPEPLVTGSLLAFEVSPELAKDKDDLETLSQMVDRHLAWAKAASGGQRHAPKQLFVSTYGCGGLPREAEVLWLLGFNTLVGGTPELLAKTPGINIGYHDNSVPNGTRETIDAYMQKIGQGMKTPPVAGTPYSIHDEVGASAIGNDAQALARFHTWLAEQKIDPKTLGVTRLEDVQPIENPDQLHAQQKVNQAAANRTFYYTCRFRQLDSIQQFQWMSEAFHKYAPAGYATSTMVADHPYFGGTGMGLGLQTSNTAWGGYPLAIDWFEMGRRKVVDLQGIEDWMGLQYMYGPGYTWEGFQLMGFQAAIFRSASQGTLPIITWITPSDETNLRLKSSSALAQGAKNFVYWTFGPTALSTENYWSDLRSEYNGIAKITRQLAESEHIIAPGHPRKTRVAVLYSISSDYWQPYGYIHMLERRGTYLSLTHDQYLVDFLTEQDIEAGRLKNYTVFYATDPCINAGATARIAQWVANGGRLYGSCGAGSRNEFNEPVAGLSSVFGIKPGITAQEQPGKYNVRGALNDLTYLDQVHLTDAWKLGGPQATFGDLGVKITFTPAQAKVIGHFNDNAPAATLNQYGKGTAMYFGACPALSYIKDANYVPAELKEKWPAYQRKLINAQAAAAASRLVELSVPAVEAGVFDAPAGSALILGNFTYQPIARLTVRLPMNQPVKSVRAVEAGALKFTVVNASPKVRNAGYKSEVVFTMPLGINDIVMVE